MAPVWQRAIGVVVRAVFTGLPVSGSVCAAQCAPAPPAEATAADHRQHPDHRQHASPSPLRDVVDDQLAIAIPRTAAAPILAWLTAQLRGPLCVPMPA